MISIVTGATSGIGRAIALSLATKGYCIATLSRRHDQLDKLRSDLDRLNAGRKNLLLRGDLRNPEDIGLFHNKLRDEFGIPDLIVNCAGIYVAGFPSETTAQMLMEQIQTNFLSAFSITSPWINDLKKRNTGAIISIGSIVTHEPRTEACAYTLSKNLLDDWMAMLADELKPFRIGICRIAPESVLTPSWDNEPEEKKKGIMMPEEIANTLMELMLMPYANWPEEIVMRVPNKNTDSHGKA